MQSGLAGSPRWTVVAASLILFIGAIAPPAAAQARPVQPFAPEWGMLAGWDVFAKKGCGRCHAVRGFGGGVGPDLGRIEGGKGFFDLGAAMWNHLPRMGARMRELRIDRPTLTAKELSDVIAFVFTAQYYDELGNPVEGERLYTAKGCVTCHEVGGKGGRLGPGLDFLKRANSPVLVAAAMWNHGPEMAEAMRAQGLSRPTFQGRELVDLIAYIVGAARDGGGEATQVVPGTPDRGRRLFAERHCAVCHSVGGEGGKIGPELGRPRQHVSLTRFAALMWNHGPTMWMKMSERGIQAPRLTGQEMADVVAYLYASHYFDRRGNAARGRRLLDSKGCLACHSIRGEGGKVGADFATSVVIGSPASLIAAMWNHASFMETEVRRRRAAWPVLDGRELTDISAYMASLARRAPPRPRSP